MDENNHKEYTEEDANYIIAIYALYLVTKDEHALAWEEFEHSLVYENRFHAENIFVDALKQRMDVATKVIPGGKILYRARAYNVNPNSKFLYYMQSVMNQAGACFNDFVQQIHGSFLDDWIKMLPSSDEATPFVSFGKKALRRYHASRFKGYGSKDSGAPPKDKCIPYRANPDHIQFLYLAEDDRTPIYEIRPSIKQCVSVAKFRVRRELKLYDLTLADLLAVDGTLLVDPFAFVCDQFAQPNYNEPLRYLPTQYLSETIKRMGFDGIRYKSSLFEGGINIVLFNPDDAFAVSSKLVQVNDINIKFEAPSVYLENIN